MRGLIVEGGHPGLQDAEQRGAASAFRSPGRSVFAARTVNGGLCRLVSAAGLRFAECRARSTVALRSQQQRRDAGGDAAGNLPRRAGRSARASLQARDFPFIICGEHDANSAPSRGTRGGSPCYSPCRTQRAPGQPGGGDCLSGADSGKLTEGTHSMISLDEAMLYAPLNGTIAPKAIPIFAMKNRLTGLPKSPLIVRRCATPSAR